MLIFFVTCRVFCSDGKGIRKVNAPFPSRRKRTFGQRRPQVHQNLSEQLQLDTQAGRTRLQCLFCNLEFPSQTVLGSHISAKHAPASKRVFNCLKRSINGEPRCSGCRVLLSSWARLQEHIEHGACSNPVDESDPVPSVTAVPAEEASSKAETVAPAAEAVTNDAPLVTQPEVLTIIQQHGWRRLASDMRWRPKLAQWCCLCGTWCASNRAVKMHLAKSRSAVWGTHKHRVEKLSRSQVADIQVPCTLCGSVSKDPKSHVVARPVIFQSILISLVSSDGARSRDQLLQALAPCREPTAAVRGVEGDHETQKAQDGAIPRQRPGQGAPLPTSGCGAPCASFSFRRRDL